MVIVNRNESEGCCFCMYYTVSFVIFIIFFGGRNTRTEKKKKKREGFDCVKNKVTGRVI